MGGPAVQGCTGPRHRRSYLARLWENGDERVTVFRSGALWDNRTIYSCVDGAEQSAFSKN